MPQRRDVFVSYSHKDKDWLDRLLVHLRPIEKAHKVEVWSDTKIKAGIRWQEEIRARLTSAKVAVLLVSADFLSSDFITENELPPLLQAAREEGTIILPLIVSPCRFLRTESLCQFQSANNPAKPLINVTKGEQEEVLEALASQIEELLIQQAPAPSTEHGVRTGMALWPLLQIQLRQQLDPEEFATWIRPLRIQNEESDRLVLMAPNSRFLSILEESYRPTLDRAVAALGRSFEVVFIADDSEPSSPESIASSHFNPKYLFETFVEGMSNEFAAAAAKRVAENPSLSYNPLFIYGGAGLGKTHLLHAIGNAIQRSRPQLRVLYLAAEQFVNELINSIRFDRMPAFRERYRTIDVLMIDDVQFLANKERTQEEFFHTFNTLYTSQKQIILSSDSSPRNIPTLEERLRSRFEWGLIADIQPPDLETKMAILQRKASIEEIQLPEEVAEFIAQQVKSNIRELEGLLNRVLAFSSFHGEPLTLTLARRALKDILPEEGKKPAAAEIVKFVARHYDLKVSEIKSASNSRKIVLPRQLAMYLCKRLTDLSYPEIGKLFNDKHHSTVMYSVEIVQQKRDADPDFDRVLQRFERHFA